MAAQRVIFSPIAGSFLLLQAEQPLCVMRIILLALFLCSLGATTAQAQQSPARKGKDYAVLFYVANYSEGWGALPETKVEVEELAALLKNEYGFSVEIVPNPTRKEMEDKLAELNRKTYNPNDQLLLFFSMHGHFDAPVERGYLIPSNGRLLSKDQNAWQSWLSYDDLSTYLSRNQCQHIMLALDACYSGSFGDRWRNGGRPEAPIWDGSADCTQQLHRVLTPRSRIYTSSGSRTERTPARSKYARAWMDALRQGSQKRVVDANDIQYFLNRVKDPVPEGGTFTKAHEPHGDFVFVHNTYCLQNSPSDKEAYRKAVEQGTISAYREYERLYPRGEFIDVVRKKVAELEEEVAWERTKSMNTLKEYERFVEQYPRSLYKDIALHRIAEFKSPSPSPVPNHLVRIEGGEFEMGDTFGDGESDEKPLHTVKVNTFYLGRNEVSLGEFRQFINATMYPTDADKKGKSRVYNSSANKWEDKDGVNWRCDVEGEVRPGSEDNHPVIHVSWNDAIAYCNWRSQQEGLKPVYRTKKKRGVIADWNANGYRLPTEAEWEYAARSRGKAYKYAWGNEDPNGNIADETRLPNNKVWTNRWEGYHDGYAYTSPVGSFPQGDLGLNDMTGNVWEWCWDWYGSSYYKDSPKDNPRGPETGFSRVLRGGSWGNPPAYVRVAYRGNGAPTYSGSLIGFRLSRTP
jgi:sulfatase modifying factor 1